MQRNLTEAKRVLLGRRQVLSSRIPILKEEEHSAQSEVEAAPEDAASASESGERLVALTSAQERELGEIDAALTRVDTGRYGRCETCGRSISANRLRAVPEARLCMECSAELHGERR